MKLFITLILSICLSLYVVQTARGADQPPTQASFEKSLLGKNPTEVMAIMGGPPGRVRDTGLAKCWRYYYPTYDPDSEKVFEEACIHFDLDKIVDRCFYFEKCYFK